MNKNKESERTDKKEKFEDDNRTVADMSGLDGMRLFSPSSRAAEPRPAKHGADDSDGGKKPDEPIQLTKEERKAFIKAAYGFAFKIALIAVGILFLIFFIAWAAMQL